MFKILPRKFIIVAKAATGFLSLSAALASIAGLYITIKLLSEDDLSIVLKDLIIDPVKVFWVFIVTFCVAIIIMGWIIYDLFIKVRNTQKIFEELSAVVQCINDLNFQNIKFAITDSEQNNFPSAEHARNSFRPDSRQLVDFLTHVANVFTAYTSDSCSVCIKLLSKKPGCEDPLIHTFERDTISKTKRAAIDHEILTSYPARENSAFQLIVNNVGDRRAFFKSNNLKKLRNGGSYHNRNPHWDQYYNSTLVVPISHSDNPSLGANFLGFLCIDNFRGGFDREFCVPAAFVMSKLLYQFLQIFNVLAPNTSSSSVVVQNGKELSR
jgi:hypothetical protein